VAMHESHLQAGDVTEASRRRAKSVPRAAQGARAKFHSGGNGGRPHFN